MHNLFCVFRPRSLSSFILKWIHRKTWILMTSCAFQWWRGLSFLSLSVDCVLIVIVIVLVLCFWHVCFHSLLTFIFQKQKGSSSSSWCEWNKCSGSVYVVNSAYHYHSLLAACLCLSNLIIIIVVITLLLVLLPTMLSASCLRRNKQITRTKSFQHFIGIGCYCYWN